VIDQDGNVNKRSDGLVTVARLDFTIRALESRSPGSSYRSMCNSPRLGPSERVDRAEDEYDRDAGCQR
jgi:hypothetical protein